MLCHVFWSQVEYKIVCFIKDPKLIADSFNKFFVNGRKKIDNATPYCGTSPKHFSKNHVCCSVYPELVRFRAK